MNSVGIPALLAALMLVPPCLAAEPGAAAAPAMRAGFDADTGRFRPLSAAEVAALDAQGLDRGSVLSLLKLSPAAQKSGVVSTPYGERVEVPEEFMVQLRVERDAAGTLRTGHGDPSLDTHGHVEAPHE